MVEQRGLRAWRSRLLVALGVLALGAGAAAALTTQVEITGGWRGLYLLRSDSGRPLLLKDDLLLGEQTRLLASVSFGWARRFLTGGARPGGGGPSLALEWDQRAGSGLVRNRFGDGTEMLTMFGRYRDSEGLQPHGLFVGGAVPEVSADASSQDESGMAYHDARGWAHIWCNVNEGLEDDASGRQWPPSKWRFLGSRVLVREPGRIELESNHEVALAGGLLRIDRLASFVAGQPFFRLTIRLRAVGPGAIRYSYLYGDEPWVGHFGSAEGNIGWRPGELLRFETGIDPAAGVGGILDQKSGVADFIAWSGEDLPGFAYVSNQGGQVSNPRLRIPLTSNEIFFGLEWLSRTLLPGQSRTMVLTIGMARLDPATGIPVAPPGAVR